MQKQYFAKSRDRSRRDGGTCTRTFADSAEKQERNGQDGATEYCNVIPNMVKNGALVGASFPFCSLPLFPSKAFPKRALKG